MVLDSFLAKAWKLRVILAVLVTAASLFAFDDARAKLMGSWQPDEPSSQGGGVWTLERKDGDILRLTYMQGDQKVTEFECNTTGQECQVKDSGKSAKVSMWFSGSTLVELETRGSEVFKRQFAISPQGDNLEVEVIPIEPAGKPETFHLRRKQP